MFHRDIQSINSFSDDKREVVVNGSSLDFSKDIFQGRFHCCIWSGCCSLLFVVGCLKLGNVSIEDSIRDDLQDVGSILKRISQLKEDNSRKNVGLGSND